MQPSARDAAEKSLQAVAESDRPEVFITLCDPQQVREEADKVDAAVAAGAVLPLAGTTFAVKDNIDVAGLPTTAGCPTYAFSAAADAPAVRALREAGAVCIGKTNLDQFATGLVGTRSPYGAVRNAVDPARIAGGSSSGSAVAVALGIVDHALGTDTAGSGRVPAALNGVVGFKATVGAVSTVGVVPACRSFDCVTVFARDVDGAEAVMAVLLASDAAGPRQFPPTAPLGPPSHLVMAAADSDTLGFLAPGWIHAYDAAIDALRQAGCTVSTIDLSPFLAAGDLLYGGAFVAERYAAVGAFVDAHKSDVDPVVGDIISGAASVTAADLVSDQARLSDLAEQARAALAQIGAHAMVLPTTTCHPTLDEVTESPVRVNRHLGRFTTFLNLLDLCAVAVPAGQVDGLPFGVSCIGPAFSELVQLDLARRITQAFGESASCHKQRWQDARNGHLAPPGIPLAVVGAHLRGQPLNPQLTDRGARMLGGARTAPGYRLYALDTSPPKPGLVRVSSGGASIRSEIWELPTAAFGDFVASVQPPMVIGSVVMDDGSHVPGFLCEPVATEGVRDITAFGGWTDYLESTAPRS